MKYLRCLLPIFTSPLANSMYCTLRSILVGPLNAYHLRNIQIPKFWRILSLRFYVTVKTRSGGTTILAVPLQRLYLTHIENYSYDPHKVLKYC